MALSLDALKKLQMKKYRNEYGCFLAEGEHLALELEKAAQHNAALEASELYVTERYQNWRSGFRTHLLTDRQMAQIADTKTPQGIVAVVPASALQAMPAGLGERAIYLHEVQDPGNLGTVLRTLAWFGKLRCLLSPGSVDPFNAKVVRASMGAIFHVPLELDVELDSLPRRFERIGALDMEGERLSDRSFAQCHCLIFGNEARGVPHEAIARLGARPFAISGSGAIESLNLAAVVNMSIYELYRNP